MGIIGRLLLLLYVLAVMAALVVSAGVCLHFFPTQIWQDNLNFIIARQETLFVIAAMFAASLCLLSMALSSKKASVINLSGDVELEKGNSKEVKITIPAIASVVERAALSVTGVRQVEATVQNLGGATPVNVQLSIVLSQNYSAPEISAQVKAAVNQALGKTLQISDVPVDVKVTEVTHAVIERERRVV